MSSVMGPKGEKGGAGFYCFSPGMPNVCSLTPRSLRMGVWGRGSISVLVQGVKGMSVARPGNSAPFPGRSPSPGSKESSARGLFKASAVVFHSFPRSRGERRRGSSSVCPYSRSRPGSGPTHGPGCAFRGRDEDVASASS